MRRNGDRAMRATRHAGLRALAKSEVPIGGAQLFVLGIVGEYLGRLYMESKRRPIYLIDRIVGLPDALASLPAQSSVPSARRATV